MDIKLYLIRIMISLIGSIIVIVNGIVMDYNIDATLIISVISFYGMLILMYTIK